MELTDITAEIYEVSQRLGQASKSLYKLGKDKAETERVYRTRLAQEILILRSDGMPVAMIADVARGNIGDIMFERDAADAKFRAALESLGALQSQLSALQSILRIQQDI
jgi:hypothetical protein